MSSANIAQTIGKLFAQCWGELQLKSPTFARLNKSMFDTIPIKHLLNETQYSMLHRILVLICSIDIGGKIVSSWCKNSGPVIHLQYSLQGIISCQGCRCCSTLEITQTHISFSNTETFPYPKAGFNTEWPVLPIVTPKQRCYTPSNQSLPKPLSISQISLQIKDREMINTGTRVNTNLRRKMTKLIHLATRCKNKNCSITLKKKVLLIDAKQS